MHVIHLRGVVATIEALGGVLETEIAQVQAGNASALREVVRTKRALAAILLEQSGRVVMALDNFWKRRSVEEAIAIRERIEALTNLVARHPIRSNLQLRLRLMLRAVQAVRSYARATQTMTNGIRSAS